MISTVAQDVAPKWRRRRRDIFYFTLMELVKIAAWIRDQWTVEITQDSTIFTYFLSMSNKLCDNIMVSERKCKLNQSCEIAFKNLIINPRITPGSLLTLTSPKLTISITEPSITQGLLLTLTSPLSRTHYQYHWTLHNYSLRRRWCHTWWTSCCTEYSRL